ncbi:MAG: PilZ domain-containing protein [Nitrospirae bacterium]|nr:PilZ domain-containing protein [Nitrospirota bacterium]
MAPQGTLEFVRKYPRINLELLAEFSVTAPAEEGSKKESALIKTLGGGGLMFVSPTPLEEGTIVDMNVFFEFSTIPFQAEVVWTEINVERKQKEFRCGLKFRSISDDDLLYIQHFLHKQLQINPSSAA